MEYELRPSMIARDNLSSTIMAAGCVYERDIVTGFMLLWLGIKTRRPLGIMTSRWNM